MNRQLLLIFILVFSISVGTHAQDRKTSLPTDTGAWDVESPIIPSETPADTVRSTLEQGFADPYRMPQYPGGPEKMYRFIERNIKIPSKAKKAGIAGRVFITFFVEVSGEITNVKVLKGLGYGCDREAVRLIESMPKWNPGKEYNKTIRLKCTLPISFVAK